MKKIYVAFLVTFVLAGIHLQSQVNYIFKSYSPLDAPVANPERGFFHFTSVRSSKSYNQLDASKLLTYRNEGITLIFRNFILDGHVDEYLPASFLKGMETDFSLLRQYGLKAVIRFCYTEKSDPPYGDATLEWMLKHIQQLEPILRNNSDVIFVVQAGFIGAWGEWYYTDHFASSPGVILPQHWEMRKQLVNALLNALPEYRQVELRTPVYKWKMLDNDTTPVSVEIAYSATPKARLGHHNDCFLASPDDVGTYQNIPVEKNYLERDSRFTSVTGETCGVCSPCSDCSNTLAEMARFHWSAINLDYHPSVINGWKAQGCFQTIDKKLGYHYRLINSEIQEKARPGGALNIRLKLINEGFSNPVNPHKVYMVLRNKNTGNIYSLNVPGDLRLWLLNDTISLNLAAGLPSQIPTGDYEVLLNMPDFDLSLRDNPLFSIRMANVDTWEAFTGFNNLLTNVDVVDDASLPEYYGDQFFTMHTFEIPGDLKFRTDGSCNEWEFIEPIFQSSSSHTQLKAFFDNDTLHIFIHSPENINQIQVFLDADNNIATGYNSWPWAANGTDFLFENGLMYVHQGASNEWNWNILGPTPFSLADTIAEIALPASWLGFEQDMEISIGVMLNGQVPIPLPSAPFLKMKLQLNSIPEIRWISGPSQITLYWQASRINRSVTVVERAEGEGDFQVIARLASDKMAFSDKNLDSTKVYRYSVYRLTDDNFSQKKSTASVRPNQPADEFIAMRCDGLPTDWTVLEPQATSFNNGTSALTMVNFGDSLFISLRSLSFPPHLKISMDSDLDASTGLSNPYTQQAGCDYQISGDSLLKAGAGEWSFIKKIILKAKDGFTELSINLSDIQLLSVPSVKFSGVLNHQQPIPENIAYAWFYKFIQPGIPAHFAVKNSQANPTSKIILEWNTRNDAEGYIIERSVDDLEHFTRIARLAPTVSYYHDNNVDTLHYYYYRIFAFNGQQRSEYSAVLGGRPGQIAEGVAENCKLNALITIAPNPARDRIRVNINCSRPTENAKLQLLSPSGTIVYEKRLSRLAGETDHLLLLNGIRSGVYLLRFEADNYTPNTFKVFIQ
ncbi:MAG: DUF4832 domain-containing protein [Bacteroidota bacterium]